MIPLALTLVALVLVIVVAAACLDCLFYIRRVVNRARRINTIRERRAHE